ncbi:glycine/D-amino acid oxidase-like deaminating enzyme [Paraburkholderia caballeronis]|uniref:FAD-dependent oxidoreductase n=1 Tax=Paraburkholderia caballeronis TaxID=416943 RepID=UPI001065F68B|nr:FAD-dependent oxidoreductase [Paraburkholderia caballeronis]TDV36435.1 glycine/D-amino acid oxidase-like deaminating enzyme [Paraburkholderia caballeronis]
MDVIVIGGGMAGVATAYQLRAAGHRVCVVERHATVAQGATYGHSGLVLPTPLDVWFGPTFMRGGRQAASGVISKTGFGGDARNFVKRLAALHASDAFAAQYALLRPLVESARNALDDVTGRFQIEFEAREGLLYVVRSNDEWSLTQPALELLRRFETPHHVLSAAACVADEHTIPSDPPFAGAVRFDDGQIANCPLFVKQLKQVLDTLGGVQFLTGRTVGAIRVETQRAAVELTPRDPGRASGNEVDVISADAVVVAAGAQTPGLLAPLGARLPLYPVRLHALTAPVAHEECVPRSTIVDAVKRIAITQMNHRLRIAGGAVLQRANQLDKPLPPPLTEEALALLGEAARDWTPGAAKISAALPWEGMKLLSADGLPAVGNAVHPRLFVNAGHGPAGWALALGSARLVAQLVSGAQPDLPDDTLKALRPERG